MYDTAHRLIKISDTAGNSVNYTLDAAGRAAAESSRDPSGAVTRSVGRVYDFIGRLESLRNAAGVDVTYWSYDNGDNVDEVTDALGRVENQDVDPLGRLSQVIRNQGGINATSTMRYDTLGNVTSIVDPKGLTTSYAYNGFGDLLATTSPDTGSASYLYDSAGNRQSWQDARGRTASYVYDALNRLTAETVPTPAQNVYFGYDTIQPDCGVAEQFAIGRLTYVLDESGGTRYCYDHQGWMVRKVQAITDGPTLTVGSTRNAAGRLVAMTYPSGAIVTFVRDGDGRVTSMQAKPAPTATQVTIVSNVDYLPFGPLSSVTFGNGRILTKTYDDNYLVDAIRDSASDGLDVGLTTNVMGTVTDLTDKTSPTTTASRTLGYDSLDRLTTFKDGTTNIQSFTYDATGNRLKTITGTTSKSNTYASDSHRLLKVGGQVRSYDESGNTLTIGNRSFVYDDRSRLRDYYGNQGTLSRTYRYNGFGERVSKTVASGDAANRYFIYDEAGHLLGEYKYDGSRVHEYVWLDDTLVAVLGNHDGSKYQLVETDHLGTPRAIVHPTKHTIIWRWDISGSVFGDHLALSDPDGNGINYTFNLRYPGQYFDNESDMHYNYLRDYDPKTGRYIESDSLGLEAGVSTFAYASAQPFNNYDPAGLMNMTAEQLAIDNDESSWKWTYAFWFAGGGCKEEVAKEVGQQTAGRTSRFANRLQKALTGVDLLGPQPAGDADIKNPLKRCKCVGFDPELLKYFEQTLHGTPGKYYSEEDAIIFRKGLRSRFNELRAAKCGSNAQCLADTEYYNWDTMMLLAAARGAKSPKARAEELIKWKPSNPFR